MSNTKDIGDDTEARVLAHFVANGYSVSVPFGDNDKYDLIVDSGDGLYRIQCKTACRNKDHTIRFNTHSQTTEDGAYHERTYENCIDAFVVRYPLNETLYWIPVEEATTQKMELRFEAEIDHSSVNWARDYEISHQIPK